MIKAISRLITWTENRGLPRDAILDLIRYLSGDAVPITETEDADHVEAFLREADPNPCSRAELYYRFLQISPDEEVDPEELADCLEFLPLFLRAVRETVETASSREEAVGAINAIMT